jgi:hypothetical protein
VRVSFPSPALVQGSDEELILQIGSFVYPDFLTRVQGENGLRMWVEGDPKDPGAQALAAAMFQRLLGALRIYRTDAGQLADEQRKGVGAGSVRDEKGNHYVTVGTVIVRPTFPGEVEAFATRVRSAMNNSLQLTNALWLNGRTGRTAADYYMIHEYAQMEFGGVKEVRDALNVSAAEQDKLKQSANNLSPLEGGRHALLTGSAPWTLEQQQKFTAELLMRWIDYGEVVT